MSGSSSSTPPTTGTAEPPQPRRGTSSAWTRHDTNWALSLIGTAIGAGILFLPIKAGVGGLWTLVLFTILVAPMTYLSHRALSRFVLASRTPGSDLTVVAQEYFGKTAGLVVAVLYFFAIYPIVLIYGVGITNTVDSLMVNQMGLTSPPRWLLSGVLVALLTLVMISGERIVLTVTNWLVWPLVLILLGVSLYLIPHWNADGVTQVQDPLELTKTVWLTIPVLIFAFNHSPAISQFSLAQQREYGPEEAPSKASRILRAVTIALVIFTMGFVFSCTLALGTDGLAAAKQANLPVLSHLANVMASPIISILGPIVAIAAISSSYFGHYMGAAEGARSIARMAMGARADSISERTWALSIGIFIFVTTWIAAVLNPSILGLIDTLSGPVIASILFLMPMIAIRKVPALAPYRGRVSNVFVTLAGLIAVSGIIVGILG